MAFDARNLLGWSVLARVFVHEFFRSQITAAGAVRPVHDHPLVAEQDRAGSGDFVVLGEASRSGNRVVAVVPDEGHWTSLFVRGILEGDLRRRRISQAMLR